MVSGKVQMSSLPSIIWPAVGRVSAPIIASNVDFPDPDRPTIEMNSLSSNLSSA